LSKNVIGGSAPLTLRATKEALRRLRQRLTADEGQNLLLLYHMSQDFRAAMNTFFGKRVPQWMGS
jgi:enoyl-CoA hydratase